MLAIECDHRQSGDPARRPGRLKIEAAGDAVDIEDLAGKMQAAHLAALHRPEIDVAGMHPAAGDEFVFGWAVSHRLRSIPALGVP